MEAEAIIPLAGGIGEVTKLCCIANVPFFIQLSDLHIDTAHSPTVVETFIQGRGL